MSPEMLAYPFLFIAIFFESFVLVTLLSKPAREARVRSLAVSFPSVAVIVPCWNEASTIGATCDSLLALDYPKDKLEIILVDDGSTDSTREVMEQFRSNSQVRIIYKENGGKHTALNAGIAVTNAELVGCLDADSFVEPDALREIVSCFYNPQVVAATAAMSIHKPKNILQHMQNAEYTFGITLRHAFASINGLYVTPGPFSFYRRNIVEKLGGFRYGHQTEDMEMALRIQHAGYEIENAPRARLYQSTCDDHGAYKTTHALDKRLPTKYPRRIPQSHRQSPSRCAWYAGAAFCPARDRKRHLDLLFDAFFIRQERRRCI